MNVRTRLVLKHQTSTRWRFCFDSANPLDWFRLQQDLEDVFPSDQWCIRLKQSTGLIVISFRSSLSVDQDSSLEAVYSLVIQQLNRQGCQLSPIPLSTTEVLKSSPNLFCSGIHSFLYPLVNGVSALLSLGCFLLSCVAFTLGLVGLYVPLMPGLWIILLATLLFEMALNLRRPFVA